MTYLIIGITGQVGRAAARALLNGGHQVRALVRDPRRAVQWTQQGVDVRQGDLNDPASLATALEDVEGAFLMQPPVFVPAPGYLEATTVNASFVAALRQTLPPRLVALSSVGSQQPSGLGNITATHLLEEALGDLPFPVAFIRAGSFLENYVFSLGTAASTGFFDTFFTPTDRPVPMVATADVGQQVARLLVSGWSGKKVVELGSKLSPDDLARAMGEVLGRPVQARSIPRDQWVTSMERMGMPAGATQKYEEMQDSFNSGWINFGVSGTEAVAGTLTPAQVFAQARTGAS